MKNSLKRILSIIFILTMVTAMLPVQGFAAEQESGEPEFAPVAEELQEEELPPGITADGEQKETEQEAFPAGDAEEAALQSEGNEDGDDHVHTFENGVCTVRGKYQQPVLLDAAACAGAGLPSGYTGYYGLSTLTDLLWFAALVRGDSEKADIDAAAPSANAVLLADIDLGSVANWAPIENYSGTFDGHGHTVSNMTITTGTAGAYGFFGDTSGTVKDLTLLDADINVKLTGYDGANCFGVIAGANKGTISSCTASGTISVSCSSSLNLGGIAGNSAGDNVNGSFMHTEIRNCTSYVTVRGIPSASNTVYVGGIVGSSQYPNTTISGCANYGSVGLTKASQYAYVGGIAGYLSNPNFSNCYNYGEIGTFAAGCYAALTGRVIIGSGTTEISNLGSRSVGLPMFGTLLTDYNSPTLKVKNSFVMGDLYSSKDDRINLTKENTYTLAETDDGNGGKTAAQFASGEVCWLLNGSVNNGTVWRQNLGGSAPDACPVLDRSHDVVSRASDGTYGSNPGIPGFTVIAGTAGANGSEGPDKLTDGMSSTKWCVTNQSSVYVILKADEAFCPTGYALTIGNDTQTNPGRNWKTWSVYGMNSSTDPAKDSSGWVLLDRRENQTISTENFAVVTFPSFSEGNDTAYRYYLIDVTAIMNGTTSQMSEFTFLRCAHTWEAETVMPPESCETPGYTDYICTKCGAEMRTDTYLDHEFDPDTFRCVNCGKYETPGFISSDPNDPNYYAAVGADENEVGYYAIADLSQLLWFAEQVNSGNNSINAVLTADIDLAPFCHAANGEKAEVSWPIIGTTYDHAFLGVFDGNGHTVSNLYIASGSDNMFVGFFGEARGSAQIRDLTVTVSGIYSTDAPDNSRAGGLLGFGLGGVHISGCTVILNGPVSFGGESSYIYVGGFAGAMQETGCLIENCAAISGNASGTVTGTGMSVGVGGFGGLFNNSTVRNCWSTVSASAVGSSSRNASNMVASYYTGYAPQNCWYLASSVTEDGGRTGDYFTSGEICWLLNGKSAGTGIVWYQALGEGGDAYPVLIPTGSNTVYGAENTNCDNSGTGRFTCANTPDVTGVNEGHTWECSADGAVLTARCVHCGENSSVTVSAVGGEYSGSAYTAAVQPAQLLGETVEIAFFDSENTALDAAPVNAGSYTASISKGGATASAAFVITPKPVTVNVTAAEKTYGESNPAFSGTVSAQTPLAASDTFASLGIVFETDAVTTSDVGTYDVSGSASNGNYIVTINGTEALTVVPRSIEGAQIVLASALTYNGSLQTQNIQPFTVGGYGATYALSGNTATDAGDDYELTVTGTGNFTGSIEVGFEIAKRAVTVTAENQTIAYGESIAAGADHAEAAGLVSGHSLAAVTLTQSTTQITDAGSITPSGAVIRDSADNDVTANYELFYSAGTLTIGKASVGTPTVTFEGYKYAQSELPVPTVSDYAGGGAVTFYYHDGNRQNAKPWSELTTTSLLPSNRLYAVFAVISETENYNAYTTADTTFTVSRGTPRVTCWPDTMMTAFYGSGVDDSIIDTTGASADVPGSFTLRMTIQAPVEKVFTGTRMFTMYFEPDDTDLYEKTTTDCQITVRKRYITEAGTGSASNGVIVADSITEKYIGAAVSDLGLPSQFSVVIEEYGAQTLAVTWDTSDYSSTSLDEQTIWGTFDPASLTAAQIPAMTNAAGASNYIDFEHNRVCCKVHLQPAVPGTVSFPDKTATYTSTAVSHEITGAVEGVNSVSYTYLGVDGTDYAESASAPVKAGKYSVTAVFTMEDGYAQIAPLTSALTINKAQPVVTLEGGEFLIGTEIEAEVEKVGSDELTVTYSYTADGEVWTAGKPAAPGEYTVKAAVAETENHLAAEAFADFTLRAAFIETEKNASGVPVSCSLILPSDTDFAGRMSRVRIFVVQYGSTGRMKGIRSLEIPAGDFVQQSDGTYKAEADLSASWNTAGSDVFKIIFLDNVFMPFVEAIRCLLGR